MSSQDNAAREGIARVAKGKRPQYFSDPAVDKLLSIVMTLAGELSVTRERVDTLERMLEDRGVVKQSDIESWKPTEAANAERAAERSAYLARVLRAVQMELEETTRSDMPRSREDITQHL